MYPGHAFMFGNDYGIALSVRPLAPMHTCFTAHWYVHADAIEGRDYDVSKVTALWDVTNAQDKWLTTINQQGVASRAYVPGPYSNGQEDDVEHFVTWYLSHFSDATR
jgi:Rieske 2Fe-2S family protein